MSNIHPYPAMIADELASALAKKYVNKGMTVLDPFCGTSRTLLACAAEGARCIGIDVNPLALLISRAKTSILDVQMANMFIKHLDRSHSVPKKFPLVHDRKVEWFSEHANHDLCTLLYHINREKFDKQSLNIISVILSATAREVSYCRKDQWKLHRLSLPARIQQNTSAIEVFKRRLLSFLREQEKIMKAVSINKFKWILGDSTNLRDLKKRLRPVDLVFSSPPYGDSRTTVQYGGISSICLDVIRNIKELDLPPGGSWNIDQKGLGGVNHSELNHGPFDQFHKYWEGDWSDYNGKRVYSFALDMVKSIDQICTFLKPGGSLIFVVGNRTVSGKNFKLDALVQDHLIQNGFSPKVNYSRNIQNKLTPYLIQSMGRSKHPWNVGIISTMRSENILVAEKPKLISQ